MAILSLSISVLAIIMTGYNVYKISLTRDHANGKHQNMPHKRCGVCKKLAISTL